MKKLLALVAGLLIATSIFAQEKEPEMITVDVPFSKSTIDITSGDPKFGSLGKNAIGVAAIGGGCGVYGLEYERFFNGPFGLAFIGSGYANEYSYESNVYEGGFNFAIMPELKLYHCEFATGYDMTLFGWALAGINGDSSWTSHWNGDDRTLTWDGWKINAVAGIGFGFDFVFARHISIPVQFGFIGQFPTTPVVSICVGSGIRFIW